MNNDRNNFFANVLQISPLISGVLIVFGLGKLTLKYWFYQINILEYISIGEAILVSLNEVFVVGVIIVVAYFSGEIFATAVDYKYRSPLDQLQNFPSESNGEVIRLQILNIKRKEHLFRERVKKCVSMGFVMIAIFYLILGGYGYFKFLETGLIHLQNTFVICLVIFLGMCVLAFLFNEIYTYQQMININSVLLLYLLFSSLVMFYLVYTSENEKKYGTYIHRENEILLKNDQPIKLDSIRYQIGRTNGFTFLYDKSTGVATVISNEEITAYSINNNEK